MEVKKAIKRVVALAAGATMMGATIFSALAAADLANYPAPFVKDGKFDAFIVVGDKAAAEDVVGAVDIGASLQFEMKKESMVSVGAENVLVSEGVKIKGTGSEVLNYNETLGQVRTTPLDNEDLPVMLAEGRYVESEGATDNDETYTQELWLANSSVINSPGLGENAKVLHDQPEDMSHDDYLELQDNDYLYVYKLEFDNPVEYALTGDGSLADDIEGTQLTIQGNLYTITKADFDSSNKLNDLTLMAGDTLVWLMQDQVVEKVSGGVKHEIKVVDVTDSEDSCGVSVDGTVAWIDVKSDKVINGVDIGVLDAKAVHAQLQDVDICELNIGATEIQIKNAQADSFDDSISGDIKVNGEVNGEEIQHADAGLIGTNGTWEGIIIKVKPVDDVYLATNQSYTDPVLHNFKFLMGGVVTPREQISIKASGSKKGTITFNNNDGKQVSIPVFVNDTETGFGLGSDDDKPLLMEGDSFDCGASIEDCDGVLLYAITSGKAAHVLEITNVDEDNTKIDLKDLTYGRTFEDKNYSLPISLGSLGQIELTDLTGGVLNATDLDANNDNEAETEYGAILELDPTGNLTGPLVAANTTVELLNLTEKDIDDTADIHPQTIVIDAEWDKSIDQQLEFYLASGAVFEPSGGVDESEEVSDIRYYTTLHGTLIKVDEEDDKYVIINYPKEEVEVNAFISPVSAQITTSGGAISTVTINKINVGAARLASEISDVTKDNLILVGGACANAATAAVQGVTYQAEPECYAGLAPGEAIIKLYEQSTGKVAMVVAGRDALDTRRATRVVSNYDAYKLSGTEVKVTGTSLTDIKVSVPS